MSGAAASCAVALPARMRSEGGWTDVRIRNISTRGLGLQTAIPPAPGVYVEILRLRQRVVGRVVWVEGELFGIQARDRISLPDLMADLPLPQGDGRVEQERRETARRGLGATQPGGDMAARHERSRQLASRLDFGATLATGVGLACLLCGTVSSALGVPMTMISDNL